MRTLLLLSLCLCALPGQAQRLGIAPHLGTLGPGLDLAVQVAAPLNLRVGGHYLTLSRDYDTSIEDLKVNFEGDVRLVSAAAFLDYHPFKGSFRLTGGVFYNDNTFSGKGRPDQASYTSGNITFTREELGTIDAQLTFPALNPYAGLGFGNVASGRRRLAFMLDLGALYQGPPAFTMTCTGAISPTCEQAPEVERKMESYKVYPVLSLGLAIRIAR